MRDADAGALGGSAGSSSTPAVNLSETLSTLQQTLHGVIAAAAGGPAQKAEIVFVPGARVVTHGLAAREVNNKMETVKPDPPGQKFDDRIVVLMDNQEKAVRIKKSN
eukprot:6395538-Karenia_brevis.AAC.1